MAQSGSGAENEIEIVELTDSDQEESHLNLNRRATRTSLMNYNAVGESNNRSVRSRIEDARELLHDAELLSRPPGPSANYNSQQTLTVSRTRYNVSRSVTATDFYREEELSSLCNIASILKVRLNAERILNLGQPQCPEEREIFDELLMTHFTDLVSPPRLGSTTFIDGNEERNYISNSMRNSENDATLNRTSDQISSYHNASALIDVESNLTNMQVSSGNRGQSHSASPRSPVSTVDTVTTVLHSHDSTSRLLNCVQTLRHYVEETPEDLMQDEMMKKLLELIGDLKKSPILSSAFSSTPSKLSRKRQRTAGDEESPEVDRSKDKVNNDDADDEEECCSICLEPWTSGGVHRICSLKCGHIFGHSCITKWIKQAKSCPQCKMSAKTDDVRNLFARKITVEDTSERDHALRLLEEEKARSKSLEYKEALARRNVETQSKRIFSLEAHVNQLDSIVSSQGRSEIGSADGACSAIVGNRLECSSSRPNISYLPSDSPEKYYHLARISITQDGNCRVFEHSKELGMVVVSTKSPNPLFRGYGIKTLSRDFRVLSYQPLHSALIRDMSFRPNTFDGTLLSCGMDKTIQLTSVTSKCVIQKFTTNGSGWCCSWNPDDSNMFYVGMERGLVKEFDIRRTDSHVQDVLDLGGAPIASIGYWKGESQGGRSVQGLLIAQLRNLIFREKRENDFITHHLPCSQAPMMGVSLNPNGHFLTSFRPGASNPRCQYEVYRMMSGQSEGSIDSAKVTSWQGSTQQAVISRNSLFIKPESDNQLFAATANHMSNTVCIWDVDRRRERQVLNCFDKTIDIKPISTNQQNLLGALSESELVLYKWR